MSPRFYGLLSSLLFAPLLSQAAVESSFMVNQKAEVTSMSFDYGFEDRNFESGSARAHKLGFEFRHNLTNRHNVWARGQMVGSDFETGDGETSRKGYGLGDIQLGSRWGQVHNMLTLVYGLSGSMSPGMARNPQWAPVSQVNSFSGYHTLAPFIGFESYFDSMAFGFDAEVRLFSDIRFEDQGEAKTATNPNRFIPKIRGFAQVPVIAGIEFGIQGAISRNNFSMDQLLLGSPGNQYEAEIYGLGEIDKKTQVILALNSKSLRYPLIEESTSLSLGVRIEQ